MLRLCLLALVALTTLSDLSEGSAIRVERDACAELLAEFDSCGMKAYADYKAAFEAGDDGRPDWMARKSCNYMTAAVEDCGNMLIGDCNSEEDVNVMRDEQLKGILHQLQTSIEEWDSEKCPAVKSHIERMKGDAGDEDTADEDAPQELESGAQIAESDAGDDTESEAGDDTGDDAGDDTGDDADNEAGDDAGDDTGDEAGDDAGDDTGDEAGDDAGDDTGDEVGDDAGDDTGDDAGDDAGDDTGDETADDTGDEAGDDAGDDTEDDTGDEAGDEDEEDESSAVATTASLSVVMALYLACYA